MTESPAHSSPEEQARLVIDLAMARPATLGSGRLVCVDGPAGSGKTTLARAIAEPSGFPVVHMDDLLPGWDGLDRVAEPVLALLAPLADDRSGHYRRWDWLRSCHAEEQEVVPTPLLVLEGVAAGNVDWARWCTVLAWVETDSDTRLERGLARDGDEMRERWLQWMTDEQAVFAREHTRDRADLVVRT